MSNIFARQSVSFTKSLTLGILFLTAVNASLIATPAILGTVLPFSVVLTL